MDKQGKVIVNYYFDDGNFPQYATIYDLLINSNTEELEGAWAFLSYVMSKKGQNFSYTPVHKEISHEMLQAEYKLIEEGKVYIGVGEDVVEKLELADDKEVLLEEMETIYSNGRYVPVKAQMIHEIIYDEAGSYFSGDKSKEEVIDVIESRVDLYLSELK